MRIGRWSAVLPAAVAVALLVLLPARSESRAEAAVFQVSMLAAPAGGAPRALTIEVAAPSLAEAERASRLTLEALGLEPARPGSASAQWLPWTWKWADDELPVPVAYNPSGAPESVGPLVIMAGLQAWSNTGQSSFAFRYAGITDNTASILQLGPDGENVVSWAVLPCETGCVLGITSKLDAHEVDMLLNSNPLAAQQLGVGSVVDWRTVILHELGHMAGLEHSCPVPFGPCTEAEADAVMYFQYRGILRKLAADDVAGLAALYPLHPPSPTATPPPGSSPTPPAETLTLLEPGWNLLVLPPTHTGALAAALPCLEALYLWRDEAWAAWVRGMPAALQGFAEVDGSRAYWAWSSDSCAHVFS